MYGLVNRFLKDKIVDFYGQDIWGKTEARINEDINFFVGMEQYPDDITYQIVGAICEVINVPIAEFMETAGNEWVPYTASSDFGTYYAMADDLFGFLKNSIPSIRPCEQVSPNCVRPPSILSNVKTS